MDSLQSIAKISIPSIGIINESVVDDVNDEHLKLYICHFKNTPVFNGNVCLAAHNYSINSSDLFSNLSQIKKGQLIEYEVETNKRKYLVSDINIISENDLSVLKNIDENILTLITCTNENKELRLCVKAVELKED